jgi:hypothetical protein
MSLDPRARFWLNQNRALKAASRLAMMESPVCPKEEPDAFRIEGAGPVYWEETRRDSRPDPALPGSQRRAVS